MFVNICYVRQAFDRKWQLFVVFFFTSGMFHYPSFRCDEVVEAKIENVVRKNTHQRHLQRRVINRRAMESDPNSDESDFFEDPESESLN